MSRNNEPTTVEINGKQLFCLVCQHDKFHRRRVLLNTRILTFFHLDWLNKASTSVICDRCGYIHDFLPREEER